MKKKSTEDIDSSEITQSKMAEIKPSPDTHTGELVLSLEKVTFNGEECFHKAPFINNIQEVTSLTIKEDYTFLIGTFKNYVNLRSVTLEGYVEFDSDTFEGCTSFTDFIVPDSNPYFSVVDGLLLKTEDWSIKMIPYGRGPHVNIPEDVTDLGNYSLSGCPNLVSVNLPSTINYLESVQHGDSKDLESFSVAPNNPSYTAEDGVLFTKDKGILVAYPRSKPIEYTIPSGVAVIGKRAFANSYNLQSLTIPSSVVLLEDDAFYGCCNLKQIHLESPICPFIHSDDYLFSVLNVKRCTLYVPLGTRDLYEYHPKWGVFRKIKEERIPRKMK